MIQFDQLVMTTRDNYMYSKSKLAEDLSAQKLLFEGCRELNYIKVFQVIESGTDVNQKVLFQIH